MKSFKVIPLFVLGIAVVCHTLPQKDIAEDVAARHGYGNTNVQGHRRPDAPRAPAPDPGPGCTIEYETKFSIDYVESTRQECRQWTENKCTTKQRDKCTPWTDRVCATKYRQKCRNWTDKECKDTWRNECSTRTKKECNEYNRPVQVPYEEDECTTQKERRCEKHWEEPIQGKKVWVDNPATCKFYDTTDCRPVTKYRTEQERYTKCDQVPYQHCDRVKDTNCRDVPKQECNDEPYQDCQNVQRERCEKESWQDCQDYPRQECKDVHQKVPTQVAKQVPIRVCGQGNQNQYNSNGQFDGTSLFDIRSDDNSDAIIITNNNDAEEFDYDQKRENIDPGFFQQPDDTTFGKEPKKAKKGDDVAFVFGDK